MWKSSVVVLLFLGFSLTEGAAINEPKEEQASVFNYWRRKCLKNAENTGAFNRLMFHARSIPSISSDRNNETDEDTYNRICNSSRNYQILQTLTSLLEPCLDENEKYLTDFALTTYNSSRQQLCIGGLDQFTETVSKIRNAECGNTRENLNIIGRMCITQTVKNFHFDPDVSITETVFCSKLDNLRSCFVDKFKVVCLEDFLPNFFANSFKPYVDWCDKKQWN